MSDTQTQDFRLAAGGFSDFTTSALSPAVACGRQAVLISVCAWCCPFNSSQAAVGNVTHGICRRHKRRFLYKARGNQPKVFRVKPL